MKVNKEKRRMVKRIDVVGMWDTVKHIIKNNNLVKNKLIDDCEEIFMEEWDSVNACTNKEIDEDE